MKLKNSLYFIVIFLLFACKNKRTVYKDEIYIADWSFEKNGYYYDVNCVTHSNYKKHTGVDTCYFDNRNIKAIFNIKNGLPEDKWLYFNENGSKKYSLNFKKGKLLQKINYKIKE